ncbi:MAG: Nif3-like dinuclear metal center hexameric protein [Gammaproteobacteria bacterium]|nr:Nif3-like dinuclear metal center hexameric protein [Gammaproteobacteria bacterium]
MAVSLREFCAECNSLLRPERFSDYCPNGLQVEGRSRIGKIVSGVTACGELIERAAAAEADALLVHHGYFWKGESPVIKGYRKQRIAALLKYDLSLVAFHLPLDVHEEFGNNVQLARRLELRIEGDIHRHDGFPLVLRGRLAEPLGLEAFEERLAETLGQAPLAIRGGDHAIESIAWCTGAAQGYIEQAAVAGVDAYLSGEISEQTVHAARESGLHYLAAGHHATERYGVQALGAHLAELFGIGHEFIDVPNPA